MNNLVKNSFRLSTMREHFELPKDKMKNIQWFPGHMNKGLRQIESRMKNVDIIIEVHDSRIPFTGRNVLLQRSIENIKPTILVLNKRDLIAKKYERLIADKIKAEEKYISKIIFTNCKNQSCHGELFHMTESADTVSVGTGYFASLAVDFDLEIKEEVKKILSIRNENLSVKSILPALRHISENMVRYNRTEVLNTTVMVIGIPNVGKSSIINALRSNNLKKEGAAPVGAVAGITRSVQQEIKICHKPLMYVLDTPGISLPKITNLESGMKLAACATLQDHLVGEIHVADYILYHMNLNQNYRYVDYFGLDEPTDDINLLLTKGAINKNYYVKSMDFSSNSYKLFPSILDMAKAFLAQFRKGNFGFVMMDQKWLDS